MISFGSSDCYENKKIKVPVVRRNQGVKVEVKYEFRNKVIDSFEICNPLKHGFLYLSKHGVLSP